MLTPICKVLVLSFCLMECVAFNIKMKEVTSLSKDQLSVIKIKNALAPAVATFTACVLFPFSALAINQQYRLPPIDYADKNRCVLTSSAMGQANAARNKLYDVRECDLKGQSGAGKDMSGIIGANAEFSGVNFKEAQLSKGFLRNSKFLGCDFTNGVIDRVAFDGSDLRGSIFKNAVLSGTTFEDADLHDTDFTDAYLGPFDLKNLCMNPTLEGTNPVTKADTKESAGCI